MGRSRPACGTTPTIQLLPKKTPGPPAGQARPRKTFLVHPWTPARHQASPQMPPAPKALEMSDKLIDAQAAESTSLASGLREPQMVEAFRRAPRFRNIGRIL